MKVTRLAIPDIVVFEPRVFEDERGAFFESFNQKVFEEATGLRTNFVQDNQSISKRGVLRGLHYQLPPHAQGKLIRVVRGSAFDVAVDIRKESASYGNWVAETISAANGKQIWIPEGFAHGFLALDEGTVLLYKTTDFYDRASEGSISWNDPALAIGWPIDTPPIVSAKDLASSAFVPLA